GPPRFVGRPFLLRKSRAPSILSRHSREMRSGDGNGEVVQRDQGFWFYSAGRWRQGRVCPYLRGGKGRLHRLARRREAELRRRPEPWQGIGRKFEDPLICGGCD